MSLPRPSPLIPATYAALPGLDHCLLSSGIPQISTILLPSWCHSLMAMTGGVSPSVALGWHDAAAAL